MSPVVLFVCGSRETAQNLTDSPIRHHRTHQQQISNTSVCSRRFCSMWEKLLENVRIERNNAMWKLKLWMSENCPVKNVMIIRKETCLKTISRERESNPKLEASKKNKLQQSSEEKKSCKTRFRFTRSSKKESGGTVSEWDLMEMREPKNYDFGAMKHHPWRRGLHNPTGHRSR